jgi:hypothetical protein
MIREVIGATYFLLFRKNALKTPSKKKIKYGPFQ